MTISVEQRHIDEGVRADCLLCPLALAIADSLTDAQMTFRIMEVLTVCVLIDYRKIQLPLKVMQFVQNFDAAITVHPFTFELAI